VTSAERAVGGAGVTTAVSDWVLEGPDAELQRRLVDGWADAATASAPEETDEIAGWRARRLEHIADGRSRIRVGHCDLVAWPG
jgi:hypothetical protein